MPPTDPTLPPASSSGTPRTTPVVKKKFWTGARILAAGVGVAVASYFLLVTFDVGDAFDDERPPIIVNSGGSVDFDIHWHIWGKGEWKKPGADPIYQHEHGSLPKPTYFLLTPKKFVSCTDGGTKVNPPFNGNTVT